MSTPPYNTDFCMLLLSRINIKLNLNVQAAVMMRVLSLPASFFKEYSSGELNQYLNYMNSLCNQLVETIFSTGITGKILVKPHPDAAKIIVHAVLILRVEVVIDGDVADAVFGEGNVDEHAP